MPAYSGEKLRACHRMIKMVERLTENGKYIWISNRIDGAQEAMEARPTRDESRKNPISN